MSSLASEAAPRMPAPFVASLTSVRPASRSRPGARWVLLVALAFIAALMVLIILLSRSSSRTTGYDASFPQCSGSDPSNPLFGIVGVNGGLANNANRGISGELHRARQTPGQKGPKQPPLSLCIATRNPGGRPVADWPRGGTPPAH